MATSNARGRRYTGEFPMGRGHSPVSKPGHPVSNARQPSPAPTLDLRWRVGLQLHSALLTSMHLRRPPGRYMRQFTELIELNIRGEMTHLQVALSASVILPDSSGLPHSRSRDIHHEHPSDDEYPGEPVGWLSHPAERGSSDSVRRHLRVNRAQRERYIRPQETGQKGPKDCFSTIPAREPSDRTSDRVSHAANRPT